MAARMGVGGGGGRRRPDEQVWVSSGAGQTWWSHSTVSVLRATGLHTSKGSFWCYMNFTSILKKE